MINYICSVLLLSILGISPSLVVSDVGYRRVHTPITNNLCEVWAIVKSLQYQPDLWLTRYIDTYVESLQLGLSREQRLVATSNLPLDYLTT